MFCKNCGKELVDDAKFCAGCGANQTVTEQTPQTPAMPSSQKLKTSGKKIIGIIMATLGILSVIGSFANDYYWNIANNGINSSDFITIGIQIALIATGVYLIYKSNK